MLAINVLVGVKGYLIRRRSTNWILGLTLAPTSAGREERKHEFGRNGYKDFNGMLRLSLALLIMFSPMIAKAMPERAISTERIILPVENKHGGLTGNS